MGNEAQGDTQQSGEFIEFSDEDDSGDEESDLTNFAPAVLSTLPKSPASTHKQRKQQSVPIKDIPLFGGHCQSIFKVKAADARSKLKNTLQRKSSTQSSEVTAKKFGLASKDDLVKVLGGIELER